MSAVDYLVSWLRFDSSPTADKSGETWQAIGNPTISDNALQLDGSSCLKLYGGLYLGGQDFTIRGKATMASTAQQWGGLFALNGNNLRLIRYGNTSSAFERGYKTKLARLNVSPELTTRFDFEIDYEHATGTWRTFFNGELIETYTNSLARTYYANVFIGGNGDKATTGGGHWGGTIEEFQIFDGVALHTENFTPPTAADYAALATEYDAQGTHVAIVADVEWELVNSVELTFAVERELKNKPLSWRYTNAGDTPLPVDATYLTALPDTQSKTGVAFYQTTRAKCFDLPATNDIWIKFDVYFDGSNRWRAYNGGSNGDCGVCVESGNFCFFINQGASYHKQFANVQKTNQVQAVLLHMVSGTRGLVEAWVDGEFIYRYNGDVNHGDAFSDIYLQSDGAGTFFSNVIISNGEVGSGEGNEVIKPVVAANIFNPLIEPPWQPHFHFSGTQHAVLPLFMAGANTFTLEVKFATTSDKVNSYWADMPTLIGEKAQLGSDNLFVYVNDERLGFFVGNGMGGNNLWTTPWEMRGVNDGNVHKMTYSVGDGIIKLTCDGYSLVWERSAKLHGSNPLILAHNAYGNVSYLTCDIYEARIWSTVREGWEDIDGTEAGLECWLKPTPDGLLDYSGNDRHATLYGEPLYVGEEPFYFDLERNLINIVTATAAVERYVKNGGEFTFAVERKLIQPVATTAAVQRLIQKSVTVSFAVERELISPFVDIDFAIQRRVTKSAQLTFDVARRVVHIERLTFAVRRKVINALTLKFDLEIRQIIKATEIYFDIERRAIYVEDNRFAVECEILIDGLLTKILPESILRDKKMYASAVALDQQLIKTFADVRNILHIPRLDELSGTILDLLNWQYHTDFYEPLHLSDTVKRNLIRQSVGWHRIKGTKAAVEYLCEVAFRAATVEEWFEYDGEPYRFRIITKGFANTPDGFATYKRLIDSAKSIRSHLDGILVDYSPEEPLTINVGIARLRIGTRRFYHDKPLPIDITFSVGTARYKAGAKKLLHGRPKNISCKIFVGSVRTRVGRIFIGDIPPPDPPTVNYNLPLITFFSRHRTGRISYKTKSQEAADVDEPFPFDDGDICDDHFIWFRMNGLYSKRAFKLRNAREDVTRDELKAVADYLIDNQILYTTKQDPIIRAVRASVVHVTEENIPLDTIPKTDSLPKIKELTTYG